VEDESNLGGAGVITELSVSFPSALLEKGIFCGVEAVAIAAQGVECRGSSSDQTDLQVG
jgi:hypothetical protein